MTGSRALNIPGMFLHSCSLLFLLLGKLLCPPQPLTHLQLLVDFLRQLLLVGPQQLNGFLQGLKHGISGTVTFLHRQQVTHDLYQATVVTFLHLSAQTFLSSLDELVQVGQAVEQKARKEEQDEGQVLWN